MSILDIGTLGGRIELDSRLERALDEAEEHVKHFAESFFEEFEGLNHSIEAVALAFGGVTAAVIGLGASITALGVTGTRIADVETGFDRLSGSAENAEKILAGMREGVKGTINDLELMTSANRLLGAGVDATAKTFSTLTTAATILAREGYGSTEQILSTLSRAEQTGQLRRLAFIGVTGDMKVAENEYAKSLGSSLNALSQTQRVEAERYALQKALAKVVADAGEQQLSFAQLVNQTSVSVANWVEELEKAIGTSPNVSRAFIAIRDAFVKAFGGDSENMLKTVVGWVNSFADTVARYGPGIIDTFARIVHSVEEMLSSVKELWNFVPESLRGIAKEAVVAGAAALIANKGFTALTETLAKLTGEGGGGAQDLVEHLLSMGANLKQIAGELPAAGGGIAAFQKQAFGTSPAEQERAVAALKGLAGGISGAGAAAEGGMAAFGAAALPVLALTTVILSAQKVFELGSLVYQHHADAIGDVGIKSRQLAADANTMDVATKMSGQTFKDVGEAVAYLNTHIKDQTTGLGVVREEWMRLHPVIKTAADVEKDADEQIKEAKKAVAEATKAVEEYATAKRIAAAGDQSTVKAQTELQDALKLLAEKEEDAADKALVLANQQLITAEKTKQHDVALTALQTTLDKATDKTYVAADAIQKMSGAQRDNADVAKIIIPLLEARISHQIKLTDIEAQYLALHATITVNETNREVAMLRGNAAILARAEAMKVEGYSEQQIADKLEVTTAALQKATTARTADEKAILDHANATLKYSTTAQQQAVKAIQDTYDVTIKGHQGLTTEDQTFLANAKRRRDDDIAATRVDQTALAAASQQGLQGLAEKAAATYKSMTGSSFAFSAAAKLHFKELAEEQAAAVKGIGAEDYKKSREGLTLLAEQAAATFHAMQESGLSFSNGAMLDARKKMDDARDAMYGLGSQSDATFERMKNRVSDTDTTFRSWLANVATDAQKAALGFDAMGRKIDDVAEKAKKADEEEKKRREAAAANRALGGSLEATPENLNALIAAAPGSSGTGGDRSIALAKRGYSLQEILRILQSGNMADAQLPPPRGPRITGFAEGGTVMVGENGPEIMRVPFGSNIGSGVVPGAGAGGGHTVNIHPGAIVVQYPIMRDPQAMTQLGAITGDAVIQRLTAGGWRPPSGVTR